MPGPSGDKYGDVVALPAPACSQQCDYSGGGKPPPPMVRPMQHAVPLVGPERQAPCHIPVCQVSRAEEAAARGSGDKGNLKEGL